MARRRSARERASEARHAAGVDRRVDHQRRVTGLVVSSPLRITCRVPSTVTGTIGNSGLDRQQHAAGLEQPDPTVRATGAFGEHDQRQALPDQRLPSPQDAGAIGIAPIDQQVARPAKMPAEKRKLPERLLGDDAKLERQRREDDRDVVDALMIRDENVGPARLERRQPCTSTLTPVVARISHDHTRAQPCAK